MQVGFSHRDRLRTASASTRAGWSVRRRVEPIAGCQPWGHPLLDPDQLDSSPTAPGPPALRDPPAQAAVGGYGRGSITRRCSLPWILSRQRSGCARRRASRSGAGAFDSPGGRTRPGALNDRAPRQSHPGVRSAFVDCHVRQLDDDQVARYSRRLFDPGPAGRRTRYREQMPVRGRRFEHVPVSTAPRLGVTDSADSASRKRQTWRTPTTPDRAQHARREDWLMLGHMTTRCRSTPSQKTKPAADGTPRSSERHTCQTANRRPGRTR